MRRSQQSATTLVIVGFACLVSCAEDGATGPCIDEPGLELAINYVGPGDTCLFISQAANVSVNVTIGGTQMSRPDATSITLRSWVFAWPPGISEGTAGAVSVHATGEGVVATGDATFESTPGECQIVVVEATCQEACPAGEDCV